MRILSAPVEIFRHSESPFLKKRSHQRTHAQNGKRNVLNDSIKTTIMVSVTLPFHHSSETLSISVVKCKLFAELNMKWIVECWRIKLISAVTCYSRKVVDPWMCWNYESVSILPMKRSKNRDNSLWVSQFHLLSDVRFNLNVSDYCAGNVSDF